MTNHNKKTKKYVTLKNDGCDFRRMSKIMTANGFKMNHATCRNLLLQSIKEIFDQSTKKLGTTLSDEQMKALICNQDVQDSLGDMVFKAWTELRDEKVL